MSIDGFALGVNSSGASHSGDVSAADEIIQQYATRLATFITGSSLEAVHTLLDCCNTPEVKAAVINATLPEGGTCLQRATQCGASLDIARLLLIEGTAIDLGRAQVCNWHLLSTSMQHLMLSLFMEALKTQNQAAVDVYLQTELNLNMPTATGETLLTQAIKDADEASVKQLLALGASTNVCTTTGETPLDAAISCPQPIIGIILMLVENRANIDTARQEIERATQCSNLSSEEAVLRGHYLRIAQIVGEAKKQYRDASQAQVRATRTPVNITIAQQEAMQHGLQRFLECNREFPPSLVQQTVLSDYFSQTKMDQTQGLGCILCHCGNALNPELLESIIKSYSQRGANMPQVLAKYSMDDALNFCSSKEEYEMVVALLVKYGGHTAAPPYPTKLFSCIFADDIQEATALLTGMSNRERVALMQTPWFEHNTFMHCAVHNNRLNMITLFVANGAKFNWSALPHKQLHKMISLCIEQKNIECATKILAHLKPHERAGVINCPLPPSTTTLLHLAIQRKLPAMVLLFLAEGLEKSAMTQEDRDAVEQYKLEGLDLDMRLHPESETFLISAILQQNMHHVHNLIAWGASIAAPTQSGRSILAHSTDRLMHEITTTKDSTTATNLMSVRLVAYGADVEAAICTVRKDVEENRLLQVQDQEIIQHLQLVHIIAETVKRCQGSTPEAASQALHRILEEHTEFCPKLIVRMVFLLLKDKANATDGLDHALIHCASNLELLEPIIQLCSEHQANMTAALQNCIRSSPPTQPGLHRTISWLVQFGANINATQYPAQLATCVHNNDVNAATALLKDLSPQIQVVLMNTPVSTSPRCLDYAMKQQDLDMIALLMNSGAKLSGPTCDGALLASILSSCLDKKNIACAVAVLWGLSRNSGAALINFPTQPTGLSLLGLAIQSQQPAMILLFLSMAVHKISEADKEAIIQYEKEHGALNIDMPMPPNGDTLLGNAISSNCSTVENLLPCGANPNATSRGLPVLVHYATRELALFFEQNPQRIVVGSAINLRTVELIAYGADVEQAIRALENNGQPLQEKQHLIDFLKIAQIIGEQWRKDPVANRQTSWDPTKWKFSSMRTQTVEQSIDILLQHYAQGRYAHSSQELVNQMIQFLLQDLVYISREDTDMTAKLTNVLLNYQSQPDLLEQIIGLYRKAGANLTKAFIKAQSPSSKFLPERSGSMGNALVKGGMCVTPEDVIYLKEFKWAPNPHQTKCLLEAMFMVQQGEVTLDCIELQNAPESIRESLQKSIQDGTMLMTAAGAGCLPVVKALASIPRANVHRWVNMRTDILCHNTTNNRTALHEAASRGYVDIVQFLLETCHAYERVLDIATWLRWDETQTTPLNEAYVNLANLRAQLLETTGGVIQLPSQANLETPAVSLKVPPLPPGTHAQVPDTGNKIYKPMPLGQLLSGGRSIEKAIEDLDTVCELLENRRSTHPVKRSSHRDPYPSEELAKPRDSEAFNQRREAEEAANRELVHTQRAVLAQMREPLASPSQPADIVR